MFLILLGAPGVGKGTVAVKLSAATNLPHISTGDIFRENIRNKTELGKQVTAILDKGELVPDELTIKIIAARLQENDVTSVSGAILDGFPRTVAQAQALDRIIEVRTSILLSLDNQSIIERLSGRRVHPGSGRVYHVKFNPPKSPGKDDETNEDLVQRPDDQEEAIRNRLQVYASQTEPLVAYYRNSDRLTEIDASPAPDMLFEKLLSIVNSL